MAFDILIPMFLNTCFLLHISSISAESQLKYHPHMHTILQGKIDGISHAASRDVAGRKRNGLD